MSIAMCVVASNATQARRRESLYAVLYRIPHNHILLPFILVLCPKEQKNDCVNGIDACGEAF